MAAVRKTPRDLGSPGTGCAGLFTSEGSLFLFGVSKSNDDFPTKLEIVKSIEILKDCEISSVAWNHRCDGISSSHSTHSTISSKNDPLECVALCGDGTPVSLVDIWSSSPVIQKNDVDLHCSKRHQFANVIKSHALTKECCSLLQSNEEWLVTCYADSLNLTNWNTGLNDYHFKGKHTLTSMDLITSKYLITADMKGDIIVHNCKSGMVSSTLSDYSYQSCVNDIDGCDSKLNWFGITNDAGHVNVFDLSKDSMIYDSGAHTSACHSCSFNPLRSSWLLSAGMDSFVYLHDVQQSKIAAKIKCSAPLTCVDWMPNTNNYQIMTAGIDGQLCCFDLRSTREPWMKHCHDSVIFNLTLHPTLDWSHLYDKLNNQVAQSSDVLSKWKSSVMSEEIKKKEVPISMMIDTPIDEKRPKTSQSSHLTRVADSSSVAAAPRAPAPSTQSRPHRSDAPLLSDQSTDVHSVPLRSRDIGMRAAPSSSSSSGITAREIRDIIREEILASEQRVFRKMDEMLSSLHSDLITQLCSSDERMESGLSALSVTVQQWKKTLDGNEQRMFDL